jgi:glutamyl-Q tRNA(Asp) synthetase
MARACEMLDSPLSYKEKDDILLPENLPALVGDVVLARRDMGASYHLSVVLDDADKGITHVIRGADLQEATQIHVLLQRLLGLPTPAYHHHRLIRDESGKRLAKRDDARAIATYRAEGASPDDIRAMVGL